MIDFAAAREAMVDRQIRPSDVTRYPVIAAMLRVPREAFVPDAFRSVAYLGEHVPLGPSRVLLDPRVFAKMLDALAVTPVDLVLDVGCGYGYSAAVIARMAEAVVAVEEEALAREAEERLAAEGADNAVVQAGPLDEGAPAHGPYDAMILEGAAERLPAALADQLKTGGRVVALFREGGLGQARLGVKTAAGRVGWRRVFDATAPVLPGFETAKAFEF